MNASEVVKGMRVRCVCNCHEGELGAIVTPDMQAGRTSVHLDSGGALIFLPFDLIEPEHGGFHCRGDE